MKKNKFMVEGIHCGSCVSKIEKALAQLEGIKSTTVDKENGFVVTGFEDSVSPMVIKSTIEELGFSVTGFTKL